MKQQEKELLLALLIDKYIAEATNSKSQDPFESYNQTIKRLKYPHKWTIEEKDSLVRLHQQGHPWRHIADTLGLTVNQCTSMFYNITVAKRKAV